MTFSSAPHMAWRATSLLPSPRFGPTSRHSASTTGPESGLSAREPPAQAGANLRDRGGVRCVGLRRSRVLEVTAFTQTTSDAILEREVAPSAGFSDVQVINVAEIRNKGFEISTTVRPIERSGLSWDLTFLLGHQMNKIIDLGGINAGRRHQEGFSVGAEHDRMPIWSDIDPVTGVSSNPLCFVGKGA